MDGLHQALVDTEGDARSRLTAAKHRINVLRRRALEAEAEAADRAEQLKAATHEAEAAGAAASQREAELVAVRNTAMDRLREMANTCASLEAKLTSFQHEAAAAGEEKDMRLAAAEAKLAELHKTQTEREAESAKASSGWESERAYMRTLVIRYMELESEHEALFPAIATFFRFTKEEVARIRTAQQKYADATSLWLSLIHI